uniref:Uncharacterized protein n=1 Tax=Pithovirus LCPAC304 TaxID=2506594 RepID=A0A481Z9H4_9VIRU|nr:MAG: hypothetical protein LCPAC304_00970 [Pithovirus LCPAC304]
MQPNPTLGRLVQEARARRQPGERVQKAETPIKQPTPPSSIVKEPIVKEAIDTINEEITPILEIEIGDLETVSLSFAGNADARDTKEMVRDLIRFESDLRNIHDLLTRAKQKLVDIYLVTKSATDAQIIINHTFSPNTIHRTVVQTLQLLEGTAEAMMGKIRFDVPGSKRPIEILQRIQAFGKEHFKGYEPRVVEIKMDVRGDAAMAKRLAAGASQTFQPRFATLRSTIPKSAIAKPLRSTISKTTILKRPELTVKDARTIVSDNPHVDVLTLREVLHARGFQEEIIRAVLAELQKEKKRRALHRRPSPLRRSIVSPLKGEEPSERARAPVDLTPLTRKELVNLAKRNGLKDRRKRKPELIQYLHEQLSWRVLNNALRDKLYNYTFKDIPIIQAKK